MEPILNPSTPLYILMAEPNPRYQLYDEVENRPHDRGRGYPMQDLGRREVCGQVPGTFLPHRSMNSMATLLDRRVWLNDCQGSWNNLYTFVGMNVPPDELEPDEFHTVMSQSGRACSLSNRNIGRCFTSKEGLLKEPAVSLTNQTLSRHRFMDGAHPESLNSFIYTYG